jgi:mRNA-degrading endonuclease RelE of RelBE toxin-antitoxin system
MIIYQSRSFAQKVKKLSKPEKAALDQEIRKIAADPNLGEEKKGDLRGVLVHKFKLQKTLYLLAYRRLGEDLELVMLGPHENYYRDLKKYLQDQKLISS